MRGTWTTEVVVAAVGDQATVGIGRIASTIPGLPVKGQLQSLEECMGTCAHDRTSVVVFLGAVY